MTVDRLIPTASAGAPPHPAAWPEQARVIEGVLSGTALQLVVRDAGAVAEGGAMLDEVAEALDAAASVRSVRIDGAGRPTFDDVLAAISSGSPPSGEGRAAMRRVAVRVVLTDRLAGRKTVLLADNADQLADTVLQELYQLVSAFGEGGLQVVLVAAPPFLGRIAEGGPLAPIGAVARVLALDPALPSTTLLGERRSPPAARGDEAGRRADRLAEIVAGLREVADAMPDIAAAASASGAPGSLPPPDEAPLLAPPEPAFKPLKPAATATAREGDVTLAPAAITPAATAPADIESAIAALNAAGERGAGGEEPAVAPQERSHKPRRLLPRIAVCMVLASGLTVATVGSDLSHHDAGGGGNRNVAASAPVEASGESTSGTAATAAIAMTVAPVMGRQPVVVRESAGGASIASIIAPAPSASPPVQEEEGPSRRDQQPPAAEAAASAPAETVAATVGAPAETSPAPTESAQLLIGRGEECFAHGDVAGARLFFERAARAGSAQGITALARTYDVLFLKRIGMRASLGDNGKAIALYRQAAAAGDADAVRRLEPSPGD
jgi:hypothetical protein